MVGENIQNVFLIQIDASNFAEFEGSEFEISRFDCMYCDGGWKLELSQQVQLTNLCAREI